MTVSGERSYSQNTQKVQRHSEASLACSSIMREATVGGAEGEREETGQRSSHRPGVQVLLGQGTYSGFYFQCDGKAWVDFKQRSTWSHLCLINRRGSRVDGGRREKK